MRAPEAVSPFNTARRESLTRFVITCDMHRPSRWKFSFPYRRYYKLFETELRVPKIFHNLANHRPVRRRFVPSRNIPEKLCGDALLALRTLGQHGPQSGR